MPASRKIVVHRKKSAPKPKLLPAATTTKIVNKVLAKNGIRPGTPMHKKVFGGLKKFAVKHQKALIASGAFAAGTAVGHYGGKSYANKEGKSLGTGWGRAKAATWNRARAALPAAPQFLKAGESKWNARRFLFGKKTNAKKP